MDRAEREDARAACRQLIAEELAQPVDPRVTAMARAISERYPRAARGILFYGSCLRAGSSEDALAGQMLDFYLIVSDYRTAYGAGWKAFANRLLPPNVFPFARDGLMAKYAVLSLADLARETGAQARDTTTFARFAQPARLVWVLDAAREDIVRAIAAAAPTLLARAAPMVPPGERGDPLAIWRTAFALTYAAELRAERMDRSGSIVDADPARYRRIGAAIGQFAPPPPAAPTDRPAAAAGWRRAARRGKWRTLLRLAKASTTFTGGLDYLAWKINRHAGTRIAIRPWQRRLPLLGALVLLPRLLAKGAVR